MSVGEATPMAVSSLETSKGITTAREISRNWPNLQWPWKRIQQPKHAICTTSTMLPLVPQLYHSTATKSKVPYIDSTSVALTSREVGQLNFTEPTLTPKTVEPKCRTRTLSSRHCLQRRRRQGCTMTPSSHCLQSFEHLRTTRPNQVEDSPPLTLDSKALEDYRVVPNQSCRASSTSARRQSFFFLGRLWRFGAGLQHLLASKCPSALTHWWLLRPREEERCSLVHLELLPTLVPIPESSTRASTRVSAAVGRPTSKRHVSLSQFPCSCASPSRTMQVNCLSTRAPTLFDMAVQCKEPLPVRAQMTETTARSESLLPTCTTHHSFQARL
jgi:hypothetical protein